MQIPIFRGLSARRLRLGAAPVFLTVVLSSALLRGTGWAQKAPVAMPAVPSIGNVAPSPGVPAKSVNVLIIALDDETASFIGVTPPVGGGTAPSPVPNSAPSIPLMTGVSPANYRPSGDQPAGELRPTWQSLADKKDKKKKKEDPPLLPFPEPPTNNTPFPSSVVGPGAVTVPTPTPTPSGSNGRTPTGNLTATPPAILPPLLPPGGRSAQAALPLARALNTLGYPDAQVAATDGTVLVKAQGVKSLVPSTVTTLRSAMKALQSAIKLPEALRQTSVTVATNRATDAASSIGQLMGYRAVVALYVAPFADGNSSYAALLCDSGREVGEPIVWSEPGADETKTRLTGAATGAALLDRAMGNWPSLAPDNARTLANAHLAKAKAATDLDVIQAEVARVTQLDPTRTDVYLMLGDLMAPVDLNAAATAYRRAVELNPKDGVTYEKMAIAYANARVPDWPRAIDSGKKAILNGVDTLPLRLAMAKAQFGRADLFRHASPPRNFQAENAEADAQIHLDRALQLAPDNPDALRLQGRSYIARGMNTEAVQVLSRVLPMYPKDIETQALYAQALYAVGDRNADTFAAYAKLWKMTGATKANLPIADPIMYSALVQGFDERVFAIGKSANQIAKGVADGNIARESAFLQLTRLKSDMSDAEDAINIMRVPEGFSTTAVTSRQFAASLINQALEAHQNFLDTGQDVYRTRAADLYRQAVTQLNEARVAN